MYAKQFLEEHLSKDNNEKHILSYDQDPLFESCFKEPKRTQQVLLDILFNIFYLDFHRNYKDKHYDLVASIKNYLRIDTCYDKLDRITYVNPKIDSIHPIDHFIRTIEDLKINGTFMESYNKKSYKISSHHVALTYKNILITKEEFKDKLLKKGFSYDSYIISEETVNKIRYIHVYLFKHHPEFRLKPKYFQIDAYDGIYTSGKRRIAYEGDYHNLWVYKLVTIDDHYLRFPNDFDVNECINVSKDIIANNFLFCKKAVLSEILINQEEYHLFKTVHEWALQIGKKLVKTKLLILIVNTTVGDDVKSAVRYFKRLNHNYCKFDSAIQPHKIFPDTTHLIFYNFQWSRCYEDVDVMEKYLFGYKGIPSVIIAPFGFQSPELMSLLVHFLGYGTDVMWLVFISSDGFK